MLCVGAAACGRRMSVLTACGIGLPPECCWAAMFPFFSILVPRRRGRRAHVMSGNEAARGEKHRLQVEYGLLLFLTAGDALVNSTIPA